MFDKIFSDTVLRRLYGIGPSKVLSEIPPPPNVQKRELPNGPSLYDGAARGWGMQFGDLYLSICRDPLFREALKLSRGSTVIDPYRQANLFLLIRFYLPKLSSRNVIELGTWKGGNLFFMARILKEHSPSAVVFGLDTFSGMPETVRDRDLHRGGDFSDVDIRAIERFARNNGLQNIQLVKGDVRDTLESVCSTSAFGLAHIDLDIYEPISYAQHVLSSKMVDGAYMVYDDATVSSCPGATLAVEEFIARMNVRSEQIWPHFVFRIGYKPE